MDSFFPGLTFTNQPPPGLSINSFQNPTQYANTANQNTADIQYAYNNNAITPSGGSVLGTQTQNPAPAAPTNNNSNNIGVLPGDPGPQNNVQNDVQVALDNLRNQINSQSDELMGGLSGQKTAQEQIANTNYNQGVSDITAQKTQGLTDVNNQQNKSLKDLAENVRNLFQSGNVYLGARGAGDSSAANQYSYAISKLGTKARSEIMTQANTRVNQINDIFNTETNRLKNELNTSIANIANWFNNAQNQVRQTKSQNATGLAENIYNQALSALQTVQTEMANKRSALETWALNNSKTVAEAISNIKAVDQSMPQFTGLSGTLPTAQRNNFYYPGSNTSTAQRDIFGNIINQ
jgi:hypothetical protein